MALAFDFTSIHTMCQECCFTLATIFSTLFPKQSLKEQLKIQSVSHL